MLISKNLAEWIACMPHGGVVAEIGVWQGGDAQYFYNQLQPSHLYLIDPYKAYSGVHGLSTLVPTQQIGDETYHYVCSRFAGYDNVTILRKTSLEAALTFPARFFDMVYIDGDHSYDAVLADMKAWYPLVKNGGYLTGHDYAYASHLQVREAVDDYCKANNIQLSFISTEEWPRWAILKNTQ